ncbi:uncharacterized protein LOC128737966 [Sabethes cyaneus]|uniref:uncharacterized protein LOC128737966 n=1 Tax=Sabethes cyaneus TaxID=53552 RepID=UPI00237E1D02|nr:uncharacterized protein LOC128737966 [Sabethes cyaneus]
MSSSETDTETKQRIAEAVLYENAFISNDRSKSGIDTSSGPEKLELLKSNRYLLAQDDSPFQSSLVINESMKTFFCKKMSLVVEQQICFADLKRREISSPYSAKSRGVKLLKNSETFLNISNSNTLENKGENRRRVRITNDIDHSAKGDTVAVDASYLLNTKTDFTTNRRSSVVFEYKKEQSNFVLQYPQNEFTVNRRKNQWDESKICHFRRKRPHC